jgi:hypothetical protein
MLKYNYFIWRVKINILVQLEKGQKGHMEVFF